MISPAAQRAHSSCIAVSRRTIDQAAGTVREEQFDDRGCEFPRIDDRLAGLPAARVPAGFHGNWLPDVE